jgi:hypothetical protein
MSLPGLDFFGKEYYIAKQISPTSLIMGTKPRNTNLHPSYYIAKSRETRISTRARSTNLEALQITLCSCTTQQETETSSSMLSCKKKFYFITSCLLQTTADKIRWRIVYITDLNRQRTCSGGKVRSGIRVHLEIIEYHQLRFFFSQYNFLSAFHVPGRNLTFSLNSIILYKEHL